jgi:hypothetical protein
MSSPSPSVWSRHAAQWAQVGPPLRPSVEDSDLLSAQLTATGVLSDPHACGLVLGVTPEIVQLPSLNDRRLWAVDHNVDMVRSLWDDGTEGARSGRHRALVARWQDLPLPASTIQFALGDGSLTALPAAQDVHEVLASLRRVLVPDAALTLRCFIRPDQAEAAESLPERVAAGDVRSFDALKWRLVMSLCHPLSGESRLADAAEAFDRLFPDRSALADATGWSRAKIDTIDAYRRSAARYHFSTLAGLEALLAPDWPIQTVSFPSYELGDRCPTVTARRRP